MFIAKVVGTVVCTQKDESLQGIKLLAVQPLKDDLSPKGKPIVAIDTVGQAGFGDLVYLAKSKESSLPLKKDLVSSDAGILGIIDEYYIKRMEEK
jgi:ethanolamine utilization protein EutN